MAVYRNTVDVYYVQYLYFSSKNFKTAYINQILKKDPPKIGWLTLQSFWWGFYDCDTTSIISQTDYFFSSDWLKGLQ